MLSVRSLFVIIPVVKYVWRIGGDKHFPENRQLDQGHAGCPGGHGVVQHELCGDGKSVCGR